MIKYSMNKEKNLNIRKSEQVRPAPNLSLYFFIHSTIDVHEEKINRPIKELYANTQNKQSMEMRKTDQDLEVEIEPRTKPNWGKKSQNQIFFQNSNTNLRGNLQQKTREKKENLRH